MLAALYFSVLAASLLCSIFPAYGQTIAPTPRCSGQCRLNLKQCTWEELSNTDNGKIWGCSFNKLNSNTALKVSYQGNIRLQSNDHCNRWYFKFNGSECSAPSTIESVLYTFWWAGVPNIHRPLSFEGYCESLAQGPVAVELWVGECPGKALGNAYTGWNSVSRIMIEEVPPSQ